MHQKRKEAQKSLGKKERNEIQIFYFEVSKSDFGCKLANIFEGCCAPPDAFRLPGYEWRRGGYKVNIPVFKAVEIYTTRIIHHRLNLNSTLQRKAPK